MSRKAKISGRMDNGPMESFWGMMKSEMYDLNTFNTYEDVVHVCNPILI